MGKKERNLFEALSIFIEEMRIQIRRYCIKYSSRGKDWDDIYLERIIIKIKPGEDDQKKYYHVDKWNKNKTKFQEHEGFDPIHLIDFGNMKAFANAVNDNDKSLIRNLGLDSKHLFVHIDDISNVRNKLMHFIPISDDEYEEVYVDIRKIIKSNNDLKNKINQLKEDSLSKGGDSRSNEYSIGKLPIELNPNEESAFKMELLKNKRAFIKIFYKDRDPVTKTWDAQRALSSKDERYIINE